jgi:peroxiredoxin family protein
MSTNSRYSSTSTGSGNNNDNYEEFDDDVRLSIGKQTAIRGTFWGLGQFTHDKYGQSLIANIEDVEIIDGVLMERKDDSSRTRIFSLNELGYDRDEIDSVDDIPERKTIKAGNNKYVYQLVDAVLEGHDDLGEPVTVGNVTIFFSSGSKGRTTAELVTEAGENALTESAFNDDHNWLEDDVAELRDGLEDREVEFFFRKIQYEKDNGDTVRYPRAVAIDSETGEEIEPISADRAPSADAGQDVEDEAESVPEEEPDEIDLPGHLKSLRDMFVDRAEESGDVPSRENVETMLEGQLDDNEFEENGDVYVDTIIEEAGAAV